MVVGVIGGTFIPSSVTDVDLANFSNPLVMIKANGQVEIVQYRDAIALSDGRWQLSTLRRGQRGTDTMAFGHENGELFVFLDEVHYRLPADPARTTQHVASSGGS